MGNVIGDDLRSQTRSRWLFLPGLCSLGLLCFPRLHDAALHHVSADVKRHADEKL